MSKTIGDVTKRIDEFFVNIYLDDLEIGNIISSSFKYIVNEEEFSDLETIQDDMYDIDDSIILAYIIEQIESLLNLSNKENEIKMIKTKIQQFIMQINTTSYFSILLFNFNVTQKDIDITQSLLNTHCNTIYKHSFGIKLNKFVKAEGQSLTIAKSIDVKNNKPILYWLLQLYLKERSAKYRDGLHATQAYYTDDWWLENKYCQWIEKTHPNRAIDIKLGLSTLLRHQAPVSVISYYNVIFPVICDRLNDFAQYVLAFHQVAYKIKELMNKQQFNITPIQLDYWIIPQMTRCQTCLDPFHDINHIIPDNIDYTSKRKYYKLFSSDPYVIWDIKQILDHPKLGNVEGEDYLIENAMTEFGKLCGQLFNMINKYQKQQKNVSNKLTCNRYIFIIDRRHPHNLKNRNLSIKPEIKSNKQWPDKIYLIKPKQYRNEYDQPLCVCGAKLVKVKKSFVVNRNANCAWCQKSIYIYKNEWIWQCNKIHSDEYYLCGDECEKARPNTYGKLPTKWEIVPESCLGLSKNYILYDCNCVTPIQLNGPLNGYKFGFSYHLLSHDNISVYWYHNVGLTLFELNDIKWAFPRWFEKVNGKEQQLDKSIIHDIDNNYETLPNITFQEFETQCREIDVRSKLFKTYLVYGFVRQNCGGLHVPDIIIQQFVTYSI